MPVNITVIKQRILYCIKHNDLHCTRRDSSRRSHSVLDRDVTVAMEAVFEHSGHHSVRRAGNSHQRVLRHYRIHNLVQEQTPVASQKQHITTRHQK